MRKKILVIVQDISKAQEHEWFVEYINKDLFEIHFLLINGKGSFMDKFLVERGIPVYYLGFKSKWELIPLIGDIYRLLRRYKFDIVHTHLFEASIAGLTAAYLAGTPARIYTRHHSDYHHVYYPGAVKYDRYINRLANRIVAISKNVQNILLQQEHVNPAKVILVHHGIDISDYSMGTVTDERINTVKEKYGIEGKGPVIGAISRFTKWKGLQFLIPAFEEVLKQYPDAILVLANASGNYYDEIKQMLLKLDPARYRIIQFENDVAALYKVFNCFVHIPIDPSAEAFGQTYLEALASRVPSVFTLSGVAPEFIVDRYNAIVVPFCDASAVKDAIFYVLENNNAVQAMIKNGYETVEKKFDIHIKIRKLEEIYSDF